MELEILKKANELNKIIDETCEMLQILFDKTNRIDVLIEYDDPQFEGRTKRSIDPSMVKNVINYLIERYDKMNDKAENELVHL